MSKKQEPLRIDLRNLLARGGRPVTNLNSDGKVVPVPDEAELFQFDFIKDGENYGKVYVTIDGLHQLVVYFDDKVARSPKNGSADSESWEQLVRTLKRFATQNQLSFQLSDQDNLENDMAKREYTKKQEKVYEGYHPMGKKASYNDSVPTTKMIIKHTRNIEEGEQRYRNVEKIFIENAEGERFLAPTTRPGLARVYARHIAEGGKVNDERWGHISSLCEEYNKMAGFVRATRNGQFNESAQRLVTEGVAHYQKLRECLSKMSGKKGYNNYFESWTPALMEDEESVDLSEMFMTNSLDPRIESVMPILGKLSKNLGEARDMEETIALECWADSLMDSKMGQAAMDDEDDDYVDPEEADYGDEYQDMVSRAGEFVKGIDQRAAARKAYKEKEVAEEVDTGQYDAVKSTPNGKQDDEVFKKFREKVRQYGDELGQRQKEKGVEESLDANQKAAGQLGPTEKVGKNGAQGKLVGAMESTDPLARLLKLAK
jgi:hypothetical protein